MKALYFGLMALFTTGVGYSQPVQLTFSEAVAIGLSDNAIMKNTRNDLRSYKSDKALQISSFTPNLGITSGISQTSGPQIDQEQGLINSVTSNFRATIGSELVIFNGNNRINALRSSAYRLQSQELLIKRTGQDIINQVALQFLQVLLDQELLRIARENLLTQQKTLEEITGFVTAGSRPEVDQYRQEADVKRYELLVIQAKNTLTNDKAALAQTLQLDPAVDFSVVKPDWDINRIRARQPDLESLYSMALNSRADYQRLKSVKKASHYDFKSAINGYFPYLSGFISFGSSFFDPNDPRNPSEPFLTQLENRRSTSYGLNLTIPIWNRMQAKNARITRKVAYENVVNEVENLEKRLKIEVQTAYNNFIDVKAGYEVSLAQYEAAKLAYETQQESYAVGLATQVELTIANAAYVGAQANLAQTGYRLLFQKILLDYATGVLSVAGIDN